MTYEELPDEWKKWLALSPIERFCEGEKKLADYIAKGGSLDPDYDPSCPFYVAEDWPPGGPFGPRTS
jgi:hypothetical protein